MNTVEKWPGARWHVRAPDEAPPRLPTMKGIVSVHTESSWVTSDRPALIKRRKALAKKQLEDLVPK